MATSTARRSIELSPSTSTESLEILNTEEWQVVECKATEDVPRPPGHRPSPYGPSSKDYRLVLLHGMDAFFATAPFRAIREDGEINWPAIRLDNRAIPVENLWPRPVRSGTLAPNPIPSYITVKRPKLLDYENGYQPQRDEDVPRRELEREFHVAEDIGKNPHPNVVAYHGCIKHGDRLTGLCYTRYDQTLSARIQNYSQKPFDIEKCLDGILHGISHLHAVGYLHNILHATNIMMDSDDTPVIVNFEACSKEGQELDIRYCPRWLQGRRYNRFKASKSNDYSCLSKLREDMTRFVTDIGE